MLRYHTRPGIKDDTDGRHSHGVALLCSILAGDDGTQHTRVSATLLMAALTHDLAEQKSGDISAPAKRTIPGLREQFQLMESATLDQYGLDYEQYLTDEESITLKLADSFDGMMYCCRELALGNRNVLLVWRRFCTYVETLTAKGDVPLELALRASQVYDAILEIYHETLSVSGPEFDVFAAGPSLTTKGGTY